ncbi:hypothetical protein RCH14_003759 [Massilia sp. MP_M2]|uniref:FecR family protein n=1 Tax=Massilia sp. MP_M2 TaxID=3071713 RepID=UPI00319DB085
MHKLFITATLACAAQFAHAAEAGKIIFVTGAASAGERAAVEGARVEEGQMLATGADGYMYVKTADNGLFILRPQTRARIITYQIDKQNPANTRVKFELLSGTARSKSGEAVKQARQNFRFNTPVAAIGVRGTDFTVTTDNDTSRVSVFSGGVVVSGFVGSCRPDGAGPCEGAASRELSALQRGQLVQVTRGQAAPQVLDAGGHSPDQAAPPRPDEPLTKKDADQPKVNVEVAKNIGLNTAIDKVVNPGPAEPTNPPVDLPDVETPVVVPVPETPVPVPVPETPVPVPVPETPVSPPLLVGVPNPVERFAIWGRWQPVNGEAAPFDFAAQDAKNQRIAINGYFALFRTPGQEYVAPNNGSVGFSLRSSEAYVMTEYGSGIIVTAPAILSNGALNVDFAKRSFNTNMDLTTRTDIVKLRGEGTVASDGRLSGDAAGRQGYLNIQGLLTNERGPSSTAATIFDGRIDNRRTVNGAATWR